MGKLKIYVADDHALFRGALVKLLLGFRRTGHVKGAPNGKELLRLIRNEIPDVVIVDLEMPVLDGSKTCEKLAEEFPEIKIIVVSMHDSKMQISHLLQIGAHAFLSKNAEADELEAAIYSLADRGSYRNKLMNDALRFRPPVSKGFKTLKIALSERENTIVRLLCNGITNKEISKALFLSENTIRNHKVRIMRKTGVKNTAELVKYAMQNDL
jgi:two-component system response regulator DegU